MKQLPQLQSLEGETKKKPKVRNKIDKVKFVKAKIAGMSNTQAAFEATGATTAASAAVQGNRLAKDVTIQQALAEAMAKRGLTLDAVLAPVAEALTANKTVAFDGDLHETNLADHSVRLKAAGMAHNLMGLTANKEGGNTFNFVQVTNIDKDQYTL